MVAKKCSDSYGIARQAFQTQWHDQQVLFSCSVEDAKTTTRNRSASFFLNNHGILMYSVHTNSFGLVKSMFLKDTLVSYIDLIGSRTLQKHFGYPVSSNTWGGKHGFGAINMSRVMYFVFGRPPAPA